MIKCYYHKIYTRSPRLDEATIIYCESYSNDGGLIKLLSPFDMAGDKRAYYICGITIPIHRIEYIETIKEEAKE
jgi:hypothetical protein